jgi:crossover junction endodeoxyribonuclease RuvC
LIILGIDPGSRILGYGVIENSGGKMRHIEHGVLDVVKKGALSARLAELSLGVAKLIQKYRPDEASVEKIFLGKNVSSAFVLGHARGVAISELAKAQVKIFEYESRLIKKGVTGSGAATKDQVRLITLRLLGLVTEAKIDATDALSMAVYHARNQDLRRQFEALKIDLPSDLGEPL